MRKRMTVGVTPKAFGTDPTANPEKHTSSRSGFLTLIIIIA